MDQAGHPDVSGRAQRLRRIGHRFIVPAQKTSPEMGRTAEEILQQACIDRPSRKNKGGTAE